MKSVVVMPRNKIPEAREASSRKSRGLGRLHRRLRRRVPADAHVTGAAMLSHDMDMSFWLERAKADLGR